MDDNHGQQMYFNNRLRRKQIKPRVTKVCPTNDLAQTWQCAIVDPRCIDLARRIAH